MNEPITVPKRSTLAWIGLLVVGGIGVIFLVVGTLLSQTDAPRHDAERVSGLPQVGTAELARLKSGDAVLLEGRIAVSNRTGFREFVAWTRDRYAGVETSGPNEGREKWQHVETVTPPLAIDARDGVIQVVNARYELRSPPHSWRELSTPNPIFGRDGERARGFVVGDTVALDGKVAPAANGAPALVVDRVFGGTVEAYVAEVQSGIRVARLLGMIFTGLGALLLAIAAFIFWRSRPDATSPFLAPQAEPDAAETSLPDDFDVDEEDPDDEDEANESDGGGKGGDKRKPGDRN